MDDAHILSDQTTADLTQKLAALEAKTSRQLVVVTLPSLQGYEIADYGYQLGRAWGIGQKKLDNGAILIVAPTELQAVRIEVGYGLEPMLTDALSEVIIQTSAATRNSVRAITMVGSRRVSVPPHRAIVARSLGGGGQGRGSRSAGSE